MTPDQMVTPAFFEQVATLNKERARYRAALVRIVDTYESPYLDYGDLPEEMLDVAKRALEGKEL